MHMERGTPGYLYLHRLSQSLHLVNIDMSESNPGPNTGRRSWLDSILEPIYNLLGSLAVLVISFTTFLGTIFPFINNLLSDLSPNLAEGLKFVSFVVVSASFIIRVWRTVESRISTALQESREDLEEKIGEIEESMRNSIEGALGPYEEVSRVRGRDVFGPTMNEPAERVIITLSLHEFNKNEFEYSLEYDINFGKGLGKMIKLETLVSPVYYYGSERYKCYRHKIPKKSQFTVDFIPVLKSGDHLIGMKREKRRSNIKEFIRKKLDNFSVQSETEEIIREKDKRKIIIGRLERNPFKVPINTVLLPEGLTSFRIKMREMSHPRSFRHFRLASPIRTRQLDVICRRSCPLIAKQFVNSGECSRVKRTSLQTDEYPISEKISDKWNSASGYRWTAKDNWVIVPADWVEISFSSSEASRK